MSDETDLQQMEDGGPVVDDNPAWLAEYEGYSDDELRRLMQERFTLAVESILFVARGIRVMESRGMDASDLLPQSLYHTLRRIAYGQMLPEVLFSFAGHQQLISRIGNLPIPEQRRLAVDGAKIPLVVYGPDGEQTTVLKSPAEMKPEQFHQAFARDHVRSHSEQVAHLLEANRVARQSRMERVGVLELDVEGRCAYVGRNRIPLDHLVKAVSVLKNA